MNIGSILGSLIVVAFIVFVYLKFSGNTSYSAPRMFGGSASRMSGGSARLPCLADNHCPMGQECSGGFCSEGFMSSIASSTDMSSCSSKECKTGINATCSRKEAPCPEGTFCQNDNCVNITAQDQGEAYKQIGMLLD